MNYDKWLQKNTNSLVGKVVAITGATGGLGNKIAEFVAFLGGDLIFIDRNLKKSLALKEKICAKYNVNVTNITADQMRVNDIKKAASLIDKIDYLILNAGTFKLGRIKSNIGYDNIFQINAISPYFLTKLLLPKLAGGRVVLVGSIAYLLGEYRYSDIDHSLNKKDMAVYGNSKKAIMYGLNELLKDKNVSLGVGHPGITATNIIRNYPKWLYKCVKKPMQLIFNCPKKASLNIIKAMFGDDMKYCWYGPRFLSVWGMPKYEKIGYKKNEARGYFLKLEKIVNNL